jgi:Fe-S cluster assembly ATP-binding protein
MLDGQIAMEGDAELAEQLEDEGYDWVRDQVYETA